ncbi:MAG: TonB-dependent receptor plug domain-containing protein [Chitinophagaceae bacterium]|nr:TonB-dependent receptor plug domain-containing protein [Chitinophagaceae bacterium]
MLRILFTCIIILACVSPGFSQQLYKLRVIDEKTAEPIEAATVKLLPSGTTTVSDKLGNCIVKSTGDTVYIMVSSIGYKSEMINIAGATSSVTIQLKQGILDLNELVISPASSSFRFNTISKIDLNTRPVKSSQELLRTVPGLFIAQHQGGGKAEQIFLRGFDIDHGTDISISVDGLPVNMVSHAHGQGYADLHFVIPELVKNIDYGKGPYYAGYGNFNTAGYVNLQTINKLDKNRIQVEAGQFNTFRSLVMMNLLNKNNSRQNAYVAGEFLYSDGPFKSPQHFNRFNILGKYNLNINSDNNLSLTISTFSSKWNASGQVPDRTVASGMIDRFGAIDDTEGGNTKRTNAAIRLTSKLRNDATIENQLFYSRYHFNLYSNFTFFLNDPINGDQIKQREGRNIWGYNGMYSQQKEWKGWQINSTKGIGFRYDQTGNSELSHTLNKNTTLQEIQRGDINELNAFAYTDEKIQKGNWLFNPGIRFDYFHFTYTDKLNPQLPRQAKSILSPKLNIEYTISKSLQAYVKTGKGFHSNDTRVVVASSGKEILPAAYGADLGIVWKPLSGLLINSALWYLHLQQEFVYVGDEGIVEPGGKTRRYGLDVSARYQFSKHLFADADWNFSRARSIEGAKGKNFIPLAPTLTSTGGISYKTATGLNGSLRYRYIKDRSANEDNSVTAKGYLISDLALNYTQQQYEAGIVIENIFNTKWNEAQFETTSRLKNEPQPVTELHYTPGVPFFLKARVAFFF